MSDLLDEAINREYNLVEVLEAVEVYLDSLEQRGELDTYGKFLAKQVRDALEKAWKGESP